MSAEMHFVKKSSSIPCNMPLFFKERVVGVGICNILHGNVPINAQFLRINVLRFVKLAKKLWYWT